MKKFTIWLSILCCALLLAVGAQAQVTVTNGSSAGWVQISPNTFGLPADLSALGCGTENEPTCEPLGVFNFSVGFASSGGLNILGEDGSTVTDTIQWFNDASGLGVVTFASDPNPNVLTGGFPVLCTEVLANPSDTFAGGCIQAFTITPLNPLLDPIILTAASDSEHVFDPFALGADSSDELQVTGGAVINPTPEPASLLLMGSGLVGLILKRRRS